MSDKIDIKSLNQKELVEFIESLGEKAFRAKQIYQWIHEKQVDSFAEMTNISKKFIETLEEMMKEEKTKSIFKNVIN